MTQPGTTGVTLVECPSCGAPRDVVPATVIRPGSDELKKLFAGLLNRVACPKCEAEFVLDVPLLYRDDAGRFLVYMVARDQSSDWRDNEEKMQELTQRIFEQNRGMVPPNCRLVTNRSAFIEKIALHQKELDDRIVEYIKYQLFNNPDDSHRIDRIRNDLLFDFSGDLEETLAFIVCDRETGEATAGAHIPVEVYRELADTFASNPTMAEELDLLFPGFYVSVDRLQ